MNCLELGAGERPTVGFTHQDARRLDHIEIVCDVRDIHLLQDRTWDLVRATHLLEHFSFRDTVTVLEEWRSLLGPGGGVYIEVPNGLWQAIARADGELTHAQFTEYAYGEQTYPGNYHYASFDEDLLEEVLLKAGFRGVIITDIGQVLIATARNPA